MSTENVNNIIEWQSHKEALATGLYKQLLEGNYLDAILFTSETKFIKCHKVVLSAMSPIFEGMINMTKNSAGPALIVLDKDVQFQDVQNLVEYIYTGNTLVPHDRMYSFLQLGHRFQVAGFANSYPLPGQNNEERENEEEIAADTISNSISVAEFAEPIQEPAQEPSAVKPEASAAETAQPKVEKTSQMTTKRPGPRMQAGPSKKQKRQSTSKEFPCEFCGNLYNTKASVANHQTQVCDKNPNLRYYTCSECNKKMKPNAKYKHTKMHKAEKENSVKKEKEPASSQSDSF